MSEQDDMEIRCLGCGEIQDLDEYACPNCDIDEEAYVAACRGAPSTIQPGAVKAMARACDEAFEAIHACAIPAGGADDRQTLLDAKRLLRDVLRLYHGDES